MVLFSGYPPHADSVSPRHQRLGDSHYDPDFDHPVGGPRFGRGFRGGRGGGRGGGRFRDTSPYGVRGGRSFGSGYNMSRRALSPVEGEYVHRNDPNLSPREGDWICRNPSCGNLNFARRTYCNNCNKYRFGPGDHRPSHSPQREGYFSPPPPHGSPPGIAGPAMGRGMRRNINNVYRSPPRGWVAEDPRDFGTGVPLSRHGGGRSQSHMQRGNRLDYHEEDDYRGRGKFDWPVADEWDRRDRERDGFIPERRGYDRRPPSPRERWVRDSRERSRSPLMGDRPMKGSYMGRGRDDRRFDDSYVGRGPGYRRGNDSFIGQGRGRGRGDRQGMARGRNNNDMY